MIERHAPDPTAEPCSELVSIGDAAEMLGMTTRTLRYYEELGLVSSSRVSSTAQRRYGPVEIDRLHRIGELQTLLGLDLDEIGEQLAASDRLEGLKAEYLSSPPAERVEAILDEGLGILAGLRRRVVERQKRLESFLGELDGRIERYRAAQEKREAVASRK
ncbi:MAG: MerR family transcriptional regulator [Acidimicrobiales bacterium]